MPQENFSIWKVAGQIGLVIVIPILVFLGIGSFLDEQFNSSPRYLVIGLAVSFIVSIATLAIVVKRLNAQARGKGNSH